MDNTTEPITERGMQEILCGLFEDTDFEPYADGVRLAAVRDFEGMGMMTRNKGVVIRMTDGTEFQLTIVKSK